MICSVDCCWHCCIADRQDKFTLGQSQSQYVLRKTEDDSSLWDEPATQVPDEEAATQELQFSFNDDADDADVSEPPVASLTIPAQHHQEVARVIPLQPGSHSIGRSGGGADIQFQRAYVSKLHATIAIDAEGKATIMDMGSASKTFLGKRGKGGGLKPNVPVPLKTRDTLFIADVRCVFSHCSAQDAADGGAAASGQPAAAALPPGDLANSSGAGPLKASLHSALKEREILSETIEDLRGKKQDLPTAIQVGGMVSELDELDDTIATKRQTLADTLQDFHDDATTELKKARRKGLSPTILASLTARASSLGIEIDELLRDNPAARHSPKRRRKSSSSRENSLGDAGGGGAAAAAAAASPYAGGGGAAAATAAASPPASSATETGPRSFASSNFRKAYKEAKPLRFQDELFSALREFIDAYCADSNIPQSAGTTFFESLQAEVLPFICICI